MSAASFPLRERGLKQAFIAPHLSLDIVVPLAGTWIETNETVIKFFSVFVVPLAGTWIETTAAAGAIGAAAVVPLAGTWIETPEPAGRMPACPSFPLRERGLKQNANKL